MKPVEPDDLILLSEAAQHYRIPRATLKTWWYRRRVEQWKRNRDGALMVRRADIERLMGATRVNPRLPTDPPRIG